jgi:Tol biopolymer transport system component
VADLDNGLVQLTDLEGGEADADWSPDGSRIAFTASREGNCDIYVVDVDGTDLINLTGTQADEMHPSWSPDGSQIVFVSDEQLHLIDVASGQRGQLTESDNIHGFPDWSPDGEQISFSGGKGSPGPGVVHNLYLVSAVSGDETRLTDASTQLTAPQWSPDGTQIIYFDHGTDPLSIWIVNSDGSGATKVTAGGHSSWSPDGGQIAFDRDVGPGDVDIFVIDLETRQERLVVDGTAYDTLPAWSPDGTKVVFASGTASAPGQ